MIRNNYNNQVIYIGDNKFVVNSNGNGAEVGVGYTFGSDSCFFVWTGLFFVSFVTVNWVVLCQGF